MCQNSGKSELIKIWLQVQYHQSHRLQRAKMQKREIEPFRRKLNGVPKDLQKKFLYLPLAIFRDHTNIRSIVTVHHGNRNDDTPLTEMEIQHKIEEIHDRMGEFDKWKEWHLDALYYSWR